MNTTQETLFSAKNLYKSFHSGTEKIQVLNGLEFSINRGEMMAVVGASGSGKTTQFFLIVILGILVYATDTIKLDGSNMDAFQKSREKALEGVSEDKKKAFSDAAMGVVTKYLLPLSIAGKSKDEIDKVILTEFDGKTVDEIIAKYGKKETTIESKNKESNDNEVKTLIIGGFGINFGDIFNPKDAIEISKTNSGDKLFEFSPPQKIKYFKKYYVLITAKSQKVREIWGIGYYKNSQQCERDMDVIEIMLQKKYCEMKKPNTITMDKIKILESDNRLIMLKCTHEFRNSSFYIRYIDNELNNLNKKERAEVESQTIDTLAL